MQKITRKQALDANNVLRHLPSMFRDITQWQAQVMRQDVPMVAGVGLEYLLVTTRAKANWLRKLVESLTARPAALAT
jgi:hypothetical protein